MLPFGSVELCDGDDRRRTVIAEAEASPGLVIGSVRSGVRFPAVCHGLGGNPLAGDGPHHLR
jgi:hypothetical protein